jgi:hypothetical protein
VEKCAKTKVDEILGKWEIASEEVEKKEAGPNWISGPDGEGLRILLRYLGRCVLNRIKIES